MDNLKIERISKCLRGDGEIDYLCRNKVREVVLNTISNKLSVPMDGWSKRYLKLLPFIFVKVIDLEEDYYDKDVDINSVLESYFKTNFVKLHFDTVVTDKQLVDFVFLKIHLNY